MTRIQSDPAERARKAWFSTGNKEQPSSGSGIFEADGRQFVELYNTNGTLAVYRIEHSGRLKRLDRHAWPKLPYDDLEEVLAELDKPEAAPTTRDIAKGLFRKFA